MVTKEEVIKFAVCGANAEIECNADNAEYIKELTELKDELMKMYNSMSEDELNVEFFYVCGRAFSDTFTQP